ncbi:hypothetical protein QJS10_CPA07g00745 [Acorus calamus]|uniref:Uncharacterized protein n=1 Tax=Acorus calamus TaxID=4465 RepID=A0AAV9EFA8_ACOCL|nr:hypothetical protein QJS10_CPA07g00745 [Acorus calamus]
MLPLQLHLPPIYLLAGAPLRPLSIFVHNTSSIKHDYKTTHSTNIIASKMSTRRFGSDVPSSSNISFVEQAVVEEKANGPQVEEDECKKKIHIDQSI